MATVEDFYRDEVPRFMFANGFEVVAIPCKYLCEWVMHGEVDGKYWFTSIPDEDAFKCLIPLNTAGKQCMRVRKRKTNGRQ
jgi:hypothetical protein